MASKRLYEYDNEKAIDPNYICSICKEPLERPRVTPCEHIFCRECVHNWLKRQNNHTCPTCRQPLSQNELKEVIRPFRNILDSIPVTCIQCGLSGIPRGNFHDHSEKLCLKRIHRCKAADIKCPWTGLGDEIDRHFAQCEFERMRPIIAPLMQENAALRNELQQIKTERDQLLARSERQTIRTLNQTRPVGCIAGPVDTYPVYRGRVRMRICCYPCQRLGDNIKHNCGCAELSTISVLLFFMILSAVPLIVGQVYRNECPITSWISLWMTVFGAVAVGTFGLLMIISIIAIIWFEYKKKNVLSYSLCATLPIGGFFFAWLIVGSVYVFPVGSYVQFENRTLSSYCHEGLYKLTLACLGTQYGLIGLAIIGSVIICVVACVKG